ncbi:MAG: RNA pyrophosphohydrolase [Beijerinckiaceae bacterium]|jgi:putative (di)nucleoside polyphosphate hydrolase|nr:RNA pyrophosphohydrolase [Beijerinckiaceae bacterium]
MPIYRRCAGVVLFNKDGRVFAGRRRDKNLREHVAPGHEWQMPQGGIDAGEDPCASAIRELYEETNVTSISFLAEAPEWYSYDLPDDIAQEAWRGQFGGQTQKWFAFRFEGEDSEINVDSPGGGHKPEFDDWRWEKLANMPGLIIPFKRPVYEQVVAAFGKYAS